MRGKPLDQWTGSDFDELERRQDEAYLDEQARLQEEAERLQEQEEAEDEPVPEEGSPEDPWAEWR